jgi:hypothetical protein
VVDKVTVKFKGWVVFTQHISVKHKHSGIIIYKFGDTTSYTYDMRVYLGKDPQTATEEMIVTQATVTHLTRKMEGAQILRLTINMRKNTHYTIIIFTNKILILGFIYRILILQIVTYLAKFTTHFVVICFLFCCMLLNIS